MATPASTQLSTHLVPILVPNSVPILVPNPIIYGEAVLVAIRKGKTSYLITLPRPAHTFPRIPLETGVGH